jgi:hypothetical protein
MMILNAPYDEAGPRSEESLLAVLAGAARRKSDGALATWAGVGAVAAIVIGIALPGWWTLLLVAICASLFGGWGIVDRELAELADAGAPVRTVSARRRRVLVVARIVLAVVGFGAGVAALLLVFAGALGTWIS